jgi:hypothetical protein
MQQGLRNPLFLEIETTQAKYNGRQMFNVWGDVVLVILDRMLVVSFPSKVGARSIPLVILKAMLSFAARAIA